MGFERTPLSTSQRPGVRLREKVTRIWNHNSKRQKWHCAPAKGSSQGYWERTWTEVAITDASMDQHLGHRSLAAESRAMAPRRGPQQSQVSWSSLFAMREAALEPSVWERGR